MRSSIEYESLLCRQYMCGTMMLQVCKCPPHNRESIQELMYLPSQQAQLLDSLFGTERGLAATSEVRAEINELVTQLEARNPNPSLEEARPTYETILSCVL